MPHSEFRSPRTRLNALPELAPGEERRVELPVECHKQAGESIENAFFILQVSWQESDWRVLVRLRITAGSAGALLMAREAVTFQEIGFSQSSR